MRYRKCLAVFAVSLLLVLTTGCRHTEDKPLWERLDEAQYNRYKPRLDHMVEKYGEEFTMDNYGTVFSVEHPDWSFHVKYLEQKGCIVDNYIVFLRRDEIKEDIEKILADIYENFKISVEPYWYAPPYTTKDTTSAELLSAAFQGEDSCIGITCYTTAPVENRDTGMSNAIRAIREKGYGFSFHVYYTNQEIFEEIPDEHYDEFPVNKERYYCHGRSHIWGDSWWDYKWEELQLSDMEEANPAQ